MAAPMNSGSVHPIEAMAYDTPKTYIDRDRAIAPTLVEPGCGEGQVVAADHRHAEAGERQADGDGGVLGPVDQHVAPGPHQRPDDGEHGQEPERDGEADRHRLAGAGRGRGGPDLGAVDAQEVREVRRQHGEAARVHGGQHAGGERVREEPVDHAGNAWSMAAVSWSAVTAPGMVFTTTPSAETSSVVGITATPRAGANVSSWSNSRS